MTKINHKSIYWYGNKASEYAIKNGHLDYATFSKAFNKVLNNEIINDPDIGWDFLQLCGWEDNTDEIEDLEKEIESISEDISIVEKKIDQAEGEQLADLECELDSLEDEKKALRDQLHELEESGNTPEIFQWYIVDRQGAELLEEVDEPLWYNEKLDIYLWGVTHWGTSWDYVLMDQIEIPRIE